MLTITINRSIIKSQLRQARLTNRAADRTDNGYKIYLIQLRLAFQIDLLKTVMLYGLIVTCSDKKVNNIIQKRR